VKYFNIDIEKLKKSSISSYSYSLRFPISSLKIEINNNIFDFDEITGKISSPISGTEIPIGLDWVLFDTGNEYGHAVLVKPYFENFLKLTSLKKTDFIVKTQSFLGKESERYISREKFKLQFFNNLFIETKFGFLREFALDWVNTLTLGINCFKQFISIIYPERNENLFYTYFSNI
jgi:hypothetical protein